MHSQFSSLCSRNAIAAVLVTTGFAASAPAFAQDDAAAEDNRIVVTAQRREERLQEVPLAITAQPAVRWATSSA